MGRLLSHGNRQTRVEEMDCLIVLSQEVLRSKSKVSLSEVLFDYKKHFLPITSGISLLVVEVSLIRHYQDTIRL